MENQTLEPQTAPTEAVPEEHTEEGVGSNDPVQATVRNEAEPAPAAILSEEAEKQSSWKVVVPIVLVAIAIVLIIWMVI